MKKVAIIGAGISGLSAAYFLEKKARAAGLDISIDLIERSGRTGGSIVTEMVDGFSVEGGPDCVFSEKPAALKLCEELGLGNELLKTTEENKGTSIYWRGKLHPLPDGVMLMVPTMIKPMLRSSLISPMGKLRVGCELFIRRKTDPAEETLAQFVTRRFGRELLEKIAEPLVGGIHAGNPETMSIKSSFPRFVALEENHRSLIKGMLIKKKEMAAMSQGKEPRYTMFMTLKNGLQVLPDKLRDSLRSTQLKTDAEAGSVTPDPHGLKVESGKEGVRLYDAVIIATPSHIASGMVRDSIPALASELETIPYGSTATVSLAFSAADLESPLERFGFIVPRISKRRIMAATFTSNKFAYRAPEGSCLVRVFVGGAANENLVFQDDAALIAMVREELGAILGIRAKPLAARAYRWKKAMPQYVVGHADRIKRIEGFVSQTPGLFLAGNAYKGISISDCIAFSDEVTGQAVQFLKSR